MSGVFQNIDPPPLTGRRVCVPPPHQPRLWCRGGGHTGWVERGVGESIFWKMPDTALGPYTERIDLRFDA
jgi:hypothetical protein